MSRLITPEEIAVLQAYMRLAPADGVRVRMLIADLNRETDAGKLAQITAKLSEVLALEDA